LGRIAQNYHVSVSNLRSWNNLSSSRLRVGQKLVIYQHPGRAPVPRSVQPKTTSDGKYIYYSIRTGDTLWDIAKAKGVSVNQIKAWNSHLNYKRLKPGTRIIVGTAG
jgi:membrane-bound lytic murein transglycosylase D